MLHHKRVEGIQISYPIVLTSILAIFEDDQCWESTNLDK